MPGFTPPPLVHDGLPIVHLLVINIPAGPSQRTVVMYCDRGWNQSECRCPLVEEKPLSYPCSRHLWKVC